MSDALTPGATASLDLRDLHAANIARQAEWCPDQVPDLSFRGNELAGEAGEMSEALILHAAEMSKLAGRASNVVKKLERERHGWRGSRATKDDLAQELADVVICADLCAVTAGIDLAAAVTEKFNATSEKQGLATKLAALAPPAVPDVVQLRDSIRREARELRALASDPEYIGAWAAFTVAADNLDALADPDLALLAAQPAGRVDEGGENATDNLVGRFAAALRAKLSASEAKYGWQNGWLKDDWSADCRRDLMRHVGKGDPLDVAAYAAFCWHHGWPTAPAPAPDSGRGTAEGGEFSEWSTADLAGQCRMQAREMLDPELSRFFIAVAGRLDAAPTPPVGKDEGLTQAARDVLAERRRQIEVEGWTPEHDDRHDRCEMATAAACYALAPSPVGIERELVYPDRPKNWPWHWSWWKPAFYRRNLVKAGALIIAEIERWDRATPPAGEA